MHDNSSAHTIIKRVVFGLVVAGVFSLVAFGAIVALKYTLRPSGVISAANVISAYGGGETITSLSTKLYQQQPDAPIDAVVQYKLSERTYGVTVATKQILSFYAVDKSQQDDSATVQSQTAAFMQAKGLKKTEGPVLTAAKDLQYSTFEGNDIVCQLTDSQLPISADIPRFHGLACVDKSAIEQEYTAIEKLFSIYKQSHQLAAITQASRHTVSEGNKSYTVITTTTDNSHAKLLFAAIDKDWVYIGNLAANDPKYANAKYTITPEILRTISDPKYGDFLVKNFVR